MRWMTWRFVSAMPYHKRRGGTAPQGPDPPCLIEPQSDCSAGHGTGVSGRGRGRGEGVRGRVHRLVQ